MTDARIEAALNAAWSHTIQHQGGMSFAQYQDKSPDAAGEFRKAIVAAIEAADTASWRPISEAKKDGSPILAKLRNDIYPPVTDESNLRARADYRWNGLTIVLRHPGLGNDGFDMGWNVAAPVGHGGFPDGWIEGWQPLPFPPHTSLEGGGNG
ncbi:hypothetical protein ACJRO0_13315 [Acetobacter oryzifermentans]|uniref:hypothetical protein n=1 Tax=Acetobacter oryzifermentans TaxID=1633874 RepID=UPI0039BFB1F9